MSDEKALPKISPQTRQKIAGYGFVNHNYDSLNLPSFYQARGTGYNTYTYLIMGLSIAGAFTSRRYGFHPAPFVLSFIAAPFFAFIHKYEADFFVYSQFSRRDPAVLLQRYPMLRAGFEQVRDEVDAEIAEVEERVRRLEENAGKAQL